MHENTSNVKKKPPVCCIVLGIQLTVIIVIYLLLFIQFDRKVRLFNNNIQIGAHEIEVIGLLGKPSYVWWKNNDVRSGPPNADGKEYDVLVYSGLSFLRDNLVLYFNSENKRLVFKSRGSHSIGWRPLV